MSALNNVHALMVSMMRAGRGLFVTSHNRQHPPRPAKALELYEFEGCPYCRKVREAMSELDLEFINRTCAKGDETKRARAVELSGKAQFPLLVDPNTDTVLLESEAIIAYLHEHYGDGRGLLDIVTSFPSTVAGSMATAIRPRGLRVRPGFEARSQPDSTLVLYNFEASPFCRKVRETLNELNLDYHVKNVAKGSARRPEFHELAGRVMVPYLVDPNQGVAMFESDDIVAYLHTTYGAQD
ncbi:glutathione S-transferase N-terminal domain-containing protein [Lujinxingia sediminis]|nr:glutathione S-transferase N-terminal domain-containing protein [Lujinxingia sediminis]